MIQDKLRETQMEVVNATTLAKFCGRGIFFFSSTDPQSALTKMLPVRVFTSKRVPSFRRISVT